MHFVEIEVLPMGLRHFSHSKVFYKAPSRWHGAERVIARRNE